MSYLVAADCDFNADGMCDIDDLDPLITEIAAMTNDPLLDINDDGSVNLDDRDEWLAQAGALNLPSENPYLVADFNLDGVVDVPDFNVWNGNKFSSTGLWSQGDANADGLTDVSDFNIWNGNKFKTSDFGEVVPEPGGGVLLLLGLVLLVVIPRSR